MLTDDPDFLLSYADMIKGMTWHLSHFHQAKAMIPKPLRVKTLTFDRIALVLSHCINRQQSPVSCSVNTSTLYTMDSWQEVFKT